MTSLTPQRPTLRSMATQLNADPPPGGSPISHQKEKVMPAPRVTRTRLSDGRELLYFDSPKAPERTASDGRGLPTVHTTSTLRRDPLTGDWVVYAAHRQNRTFLPPANEDPLAPTRPGVNPSEIPEDSYEVVVFENRFPSLSMHQDDDCAELVDGEELFPQAPARARCEVVCFTPDADGSFAQLPVERKRLLIDVWAHRTAELSAIEGVRQVFPFENRGEEIGVTLHHPHGQIYSYPFVPPRAAAVARRAAEFREEYGESLFDAVLDAELRAGTRVIAQTEHFVVFTPAAAKWPVEAMVMATRPVPNFAELSEEERDDLADVLDRLFRAVEGFFEGVERLPYIAAWNQAPVEAPEDGRLTLQLFSLMRSPNRMKFLAGSESGMGVWINDTTPEKIAARLRELWADTPGRAGRAGAPGADVNADVFEQTHTDAELDRKARALFGSAFHVEPEGTWVAPGRVNVIGDHVDYAGGLCLPFALGISTVVAASRRDDRTVRVVASGPEGESWKASVDLDHIVGEGELPDFRGYTAGTVWALGAGGMDIAVASDVPVGSGLSSSAAVECAVAVAAADLYGLGGSEKTAGAAASPDRDDVLIDAAIRAENDVVGASTGGLDQRIVVSATKGQALMLDFLENDYRQVPWNFDGLHLVVANTRAPHSHVSGDYATRRGLIDAVAKACGGLKAFRDEAVIEEAAGKADAIGSDAALIRRRVRHVVTEIHRTREAVDALASNDPELFGRLMNQSHDSLRDDFEVVTPELESAVQAARKAGALGARVTGGGFGGSIVALCSDPAAVATAIVTAAENNGFPRPQIFAALPETGARRLS